MHLWETRLESNVSSFANFGESWLGNNISGTMSASLPRFYSIVRGHDTQLVECNNFNFSPVPDYIKASVDAVIGIHLEEGSGDILVFLTGQVRLCVILSEFCNYFFWMKW